MPDANGEEDRLRREWILADWKRSALQAELDKPTFSRSLNAQTVLVNKVKAAGDKCHSLMVALRAHRKTRGQSA